MLEVQCISFLTWCINELRSSILKIDQQNSRLNNKGQDLSGAKQKHSLLYGRDLDVKNPELAFELLQLARFPLMFIGLLFGDHRAYEISLLSSSGIFALMQTLLRILGIFYTNSFILMCIYKINYLGIYNVYLFSFFLSVVCLMNYC